MVSEAGFEPTPSNEGVGSDPTSDRTKGKICYWILHRKNLSVCQKPISEQRQRQSMK